MTPNPASPEPSTSYEAASPSPAASSPREAAPATPSPTVSVTRTGERTLIGRNSRGDEVKIGPADVEGHFSPGELLRLAVLGCSGMSVDFTVGRRLGPDFAMEIVSENGSDPDLNRYAVIDKRFSLDLDALDETERAKLLGLMAKAIETKCTVERSVTHGIEIDATVNGEPLH